MLIKVAPLLICLLASAACGARAAGSVTQPLDSHAREARIRAFATSELAEGQRLLHASRPALAERVRLAQVHFANAEAVLVLPRDARTLADLHVWLGIAQMQLAQGERARTHFHIARGLFASVRAESEVEAVEHLLRRAR